MRRLRRAALALALGFAGDAIAAEYFVCGCAAGNDQANGMSPASAGPQPPDAGAHQNPDRVFADGPEP